MIYGKKQRLLAWLFTAAAGCLLYGLYDFWPNLFTALFAPTCESLWEQLKVLAWPYLAAALVLTWDRPTGVRPWLLTLLILCAGMLGAGYLYYFQLGGESPWAIRIFWFLALIVGFCFPVQFSGPFHGVKWKLPMVGTAMLLLLIVIFTLSHPDQLLFVDLSGANVWSQLPC